MDNDQPLSPNKQLVEALSGKSNTKSLIFDRALEVFNSLKETLYESEKIEFDINRFNRECREIIMPHGLRTPANMKTIAQMGTVYGIDVDTMKKLVGKAVDIEEGDTPEILQKRVMEQAEWELLPKATEIVAARLAGKAR